MTFKNVVYIDSDQYRHDQPRTQALHCFCRDQWQLINAKRARVLGQHATGNCSAWQKMHQTWRTSYSKHIRRKIPSC